MKIVVTGLIGSIPLAGLTVHYLQYVLGLRDLGHDVLYLEDTGSLCYDPASDRMVEDSTAGLSYLSSVMATYGLSDQWAFISHTDDLYGVSQYKRNLFISSADLFLNVTGAGLMRDEYLRIPRRSFIDTDPGFIHMRIARGSDKDEDHLRKHTHFFSFGCNLGDPDCDVPTGDYDWLPTVQPIVDYLWPPSSPPSSAPFTTIMKWKSYSPEEFQGVVYGLKDIELSKFITLPGQVEQNMELAIAGTPPTDELLAAGWRIIQALDVSTSLENYRAYIRRSRGEWSVAKNAYVTLKTGWFSERSACYMASGRPVVVQETGFSSWMDLTGWGVIGFSTMGEAIAGLESIDADYERHAQEARDMAMTYFSAPVVLSRLIEQSS